MSKIVFKTDNSSNVVRMQSNCSVQSSVLRAMFANDKLCDVSLVGTHREGEDATFPLKPIRAYKSVLANASRYFHDLFTVDGFIVSHQPEFKIGVDHESLCSIVRFIHLDELELGITEAVDKVRGVLISAKHLIMMELADACEAFLTGDGQLKVDNCVQLWSFARKYTCIELMHACSTLIAAHVDEMPENTEFLSMSYADCSKLLMSEAFIARDGEERYRAAVAWLESGLEGRTDCVRDILNMVPFTSGHLPIDAVLEADSCSNMLKRHAPDMVNEAMRSALKRAKLALAAPAAPSVHKQSDADSWYLAGGERSSDTRAKKILDTSSFLKYDLLRRSWASLPSLPWTRSFAGICALNERVIIFGGRKDKKVTNTVDEYDLATETWSASAVKLRLPREELAACADGVGSAYAFGGWNSGTINLTEKYNNDNGPATLARLSDMVLERYSFASSYCAARNSSNIFIAGGSDSIGASDFIQKYDIDKNEWSTVGEMAQGRWGLTAALSGDDMYLVGGGEDSTDAVVEIFNVHTGIIRQGPDLSTERHGCCGMTICEGRVVCVLGGRSLGDEALKTTETFDVREGKWSTGVIVPDMPVGLAYFGLAAV